MLTIKELDANVRSAQQVLGAAMEKKYPEGTSVWFRKGNMVGYVPATVICTRGDASLRVKNETTGKSRWIFHHNLELAYQ